MINLNLEIDDEQYALELPGSWEDVSVKQYQEIASINKEGKTDIEIFVEIFTIFTGIDKELVYMIPINQFNSLVKTFAFTTKAIDVAPVDYVELEGEQYWLKKDFEQLTMGETISIELILKENDGRLERVIDRLLCIFLRKKKESGKLESFKNSFMERAELFGQVKITDVHNLFVFFSTGRTSL